MWITITIVTVALVTMHVTAALYLRCIVAPKMPIGADGYSRAWQGEDGKDYRMCLATGKIVPC